MALGLIINPDVMNRNPSWAMWIQWAPQPVWASVATALASLQIAGHWYRFRHFRCIATAGAVIFWWGMAVAQIYAWPAGAGVLLHSLFALVNLATLFIISTERFHGAYHGYK